MGAFSTWVGFGYTLQNIGVTLCEFAERRPEAFLGVWAAAGGPVGSA
jgi:hypothetical protein